ncbi:SEC-C domain-containing protein [Patescibacteria group bacterium]|nr:SEC-C domain-containing protein [Patescibacteria group bacterium]
MAKKDKDDAGKIPNLETTLKELEELVSKPGYLYSLLIITLHDLFIPLDQYLNVNWWDRVSYQEVGLLFGLVIKRPLDLETVPDEETAKKYIDQTYPLLQKVHDYYSLTAFSSMIEKTMKRKEQGLPIPPRPGIFTSSEAIVESVFYGDSGAYDFQYWESAPVRYAKDKEWIIEHLGFSIEDAVLFSKTVKESAERIRPEPPEKSDFRSFCEWVLSIFTVNTDEIGFDKTVAQKIATRFSVVPGKSNKSFRAPSDSNEIETKPLIRISDTNYLLPVSFDLSRAIDESPFYWVKELDEKYFPTAQKHRGEYTEEVAFQKLKRVFGESNVYKGAKIQRQKGEGIKKKGLVFTDVDVLVLLGNKAIAVQAKSKKMTFLSRKGDLNQLGIDFRKAVQEAYEQGLESKQHILARDAVFIDANGNEIKLHESINEAYIVSVTTDNYPALYMQVHAFLERKESDPWPIAMNIFDLDLLTTYLPDPYDFLYYVNQRVKLADKIMGGTEITSLGYHLDQKLYIDPASDATHIALVQDFGQVIDDDVMRQRYGSEEDKKKSKIRQKWKNESFTKLITQIKASKEPGLTDAIFFLYTLSSKTADTLIKMMESAKTKALSDHGPHSMAMPLDHGKGGITYVVEYERRKGLHEHIMAYSVSRKYITKADEWLGLGSYAESPNIIDSVVYSNEPWHEDPKLQKLADVMIKPGQMISRKIGRNDPCYCGSGKKYKKCHYLK